MSVKVKGQIRHPGQWKRNGILYTETIATMAVTVADCNIANAAVHYCITLYKSSILRSLKELFRGIKLANLNNALARGVTIGHKVAGRWDILL